MTMRPMSSAPRDGTEIIVRTYGGQVFRAKWEDGFLNEDEEDCCCWVATVEGDHPDCWTDGVCWASNEAGEPSDPPKAWRPAPTQHRTKEAA